MSTQIKKGLEGILIITMILVLTPLAAHSEEYRVDSGDILLITVYEQSDLTTKAMVDSKGEIAFPLLGNVLVLGLSTNKIAEKLTSLLERDYIVDPQVNVFIERYAPKKVFVMGLVNRPGEYELFKDRPTTALEAITMAGGFKEGSAPNGTKIIRVEDGKEMTITLKVTDITKRGAKDKDVPIRPGDIIVVPESFF